MVLLYPPQRALGHPLGHNLRSRRNSWPDDATCGGPGGQNFCSLEQSNFYIFLMRHSSLKNLTDKSTINQLNM